MSIAKSSLASLVSKLVYNATDSDRDRLLDVSRALLSPPIKPKKKPTDSDSSSAVKIRHLWGVSGKDHNVMIGTTYNFTASKTLAESMLLDPDPEVKQEAGKVLCLIKEYKTKELHDTFDQDLQKQPLRFIASKSLAERMWLDSDPGVKQEAAYILFTIAIELKDKAMTNNVYQRYKTTFEDDDLTTLLEIELADDLTWVLNNVDGAIADFIKYGDSQQTVEVLSYMIIEESKKDLTEGIRQIVLFADVFEHLKSDQACYYALDVCELALKVKRYDLIEKYANKLVNSKCSIHPRSIFTAHGYMFLNQLPHLTGQYTQILQDHLMKHHKYVTKCYLGNVDVEWDHTERYDVDNF